MWIDTVKALRPRFVIVFEGWSGEGSKKIDGNWSAPCDPQFDAAYKRDLADLARRIAGSGSEVLVVVPPIPVAGDLPFRHARLWGSTPEGELQDLFDERGACQNRVKFEVVEQGNARLLDLQRRVCPDGSCRRHLGNSLLRSDGMHFEGPGAVWASRWMLAQLEPDDLN